MSLKLKFCEKDGFKGYSENFKNNVHSQAVNDGPPLALLALALPLVHLQDQLEEGALGGGHFPMPRPSQVLELANH